MILYECQDFVARLLLVCFFSTVPLIQIVSRPLLANVCICCGCGSCVRLFSLAIVLAVAVCPEPGWSHRFFSFVSLFYHLGNYVLVQKPLFLIWRTKKRCPATCVSSPQKSWFSLCVWMCSCFKGGLDGKIRPIVFVVSHCKTHWFLHRNRATKRLNKLKKKN